MRTYTKMLVALCLLLCAAHPAIAQPAQIQQQARRYFFNDDYRSAVVLLEDAGALSPEGYYLLGRAYQELLQHERAVKAFAQADTTSVRLLAAWGRSLNRLGRTRAATKRYRHAYRLDSTHTGVATALAKLYVQADRWPEVKAIYARLLKEDPDNPFLLAQLGTAYRALDSTQAAIRSYEEAYRLNPQSIEVPLKLSGLYASIDSLDAARAVTERALARHAAHPALWHRRGEIAFRAEHYTPAVNAFRSALFYGDSSAVNLRKLGMALYLTQHYEAAARPLRRAYRADSSHAMTTFYLGMVEKHFDHYDRTIYLLKRTTQLLGQSTLAEVYARLGGTYGEMEQYDEALRAYRLVLRLAPEKKTILFRLAALYEEYYADPATALRHYQRFLEQVDEDTLALMRAYAHERINAIEDTLREKRFFEQSGAALPVSDSIQ